jgi:hypothetical protein
MKTRKFLLPAVLLGSACIIFSCTKNGAGPVSTVSADISAIFSATIGGVSWKTDTVSAVMLNSSHEGEQVREKLMTITGISANRTITIILKDTTSVTASDSSFSTRQYAVNNWQTGAAFGYAYGRIAMGHDSVWQQQGASVSGTATVTACDAVNKKITGIFNFTARLITIDSTGLKFDSAIVSNGAFKNIPYKYVQQR